MKGKFFLYSRKSTDEADRQVLSIEAQNHELRELAGKEGLVSIFSILDARYFKEPFLLVETPRLFSLSASSSRVWRPDE